MNSIYYCTNDNNNNCPKKDNCMRYLDANKSICKATLYKMACTDTNGRILFMPKENTEDGDCNPEQTG